MLFLIVVLSKMFVQFGFIDEVYKFWESLFIIGCILVGIKVEKGNLIFFCLEMEVEVEYIKE